MSAKITATVRVIVCLDVEVAWVDGQLTMAEAADVAKHQAEEAVKDAVANRLADAHACEVRLATGAKPEGTPRRVTATLVLS